MWFMMLSLGRSLAIMVIMTTCTATWTSASPFPTDPTLSQANEVTEKNDFWSVVGSSSPPSPLVPPQHLYTGPNPSGTILSGAPFPPFYPGQAAAANANGNGGPVGSSDIHPGAQAYLPHGPPGSQPGWSYYPSDVPTEPPTKRLRVGLSPGPVNPLADSRVGIPGPSQSRPLAAQYSIIDPVVRTFSTMQEGPHQEAPYMESWRGLISALQTAKDIQQGNLKAFSDRKALIDLIVRDLQSSVTASTKLKPKIAKVFETKFFTNFRTVEGKKNKLAMLFVSLQRFQSNARQLHILKHMFELHRKEIVRTKSYIESQLKSLQLLSESLSAAAYLFTFEQNDKALDLMLADIDENPDAAATRSATADGDAGENLKSMLSNQITIVQSAMKSIENDICAESLSNQHTFESIARELKIFEAKETVVKSKLAEYERESAGHLYDHQKLETSFRTTIIEDLIEDLLLITNQIRGLNGDADSVANSRRELITKFHAKLHEVTAAINNMVGVITAAEDFDQPYQALKIREKLARTLFHDISYTLPLLRKINSLSGAGESFKSVVPTPDEASKIAEKWFQEELSQQSTLLHDLGGSMFTGWPPASSSAGTSSHELGGKALAVGTLSHDDAGEAPVKGLTPKTHPLRINWSLVEVPLKFLKQSTQV
ncbi:hypothetical protein CXG81DRAFT_19928 [Caulochytrium protostelioides]|uniref:Uncharacterized protein n=1 Tax=Caulochytrium protostelioides TaxID=1555241 RepID=A0A4P9X4R5_9FUNG|nr:hypothetical protein CXG81DRAFT_19928 [Caulochytrium protostelioides]|eukprot:RKP00073.1 hypothetical protein CXG81DRAFT_19928 [Caulochytrium protostelioides]